MLDLATDSSNQLLAHNLQSCSEFVKKWQPAFSGTFDVGEFRHINPLKRVNVSRTPSAQSMITHGPVNLQDCHIKITDDNNNAAHLGIEDALDLSLLIPYVPVQHKVKSHFNVYRLYSEQKASESQYKFIDFY